MRLSGPCRIQSIYIHAISGRWSELYLHINGEHLHEHANGNIPDRVNIQFPFFRVPPTVSISGKRFTSFSHVYIVP